MSNSKQYQKDEDDNISLADMMSLKMTLTDTQKKLKNDTPLMWNHDYLPQQQQQQQIWYQQQQQLQASYYQLQYLQQQQMMSMMMRYKSHSSSHSNTSSRRSSTISSVSSNHSSSNHSSSSHKPSHQRSSLLLHQQQQQHFASRSSISSDKSTKSDTLSQVPKRRQSLGKRIKKAFRMSTGTAIQEEEEMKLPDSPNSNISRPTRYHRQPPSFDLPSPALSTVSTISSSTTTFTKKSLSFDPVIKLHETFSASEYDRRCDTRVTCQKLTPVLALQIKEELNHFKLNDMLVHTDSRQNTHFFI